MTTQPAQNAASRVIFDPPEATPTIGSLPRDPADRVVRIAGLVQVSGCVACGGRLEQRCTDRSCRYG